MSRYRSSGSHGQHVQHVAYDHFRLSWTVDFYYPTSRLRHPRTYRRDTDYAGAVRFAKKWGLEDERTLKALENKPEHSK